MSKTERHSVEEIADKVSRQGYSIESIKKSITAYGNQRFNEGKALSASTRDKDCAFIQGFNTGVEDAANVSESVLMCQDDIHTHKKRIVEAIRKLKK